MPDADRRWYQPSLRSLLMVVAVLACAMTPLAWIARERQQMLRAQRELLLAREMALRSVVRENVYRQAASRADPGPESTAPDEARRLRAQNDSLRREVESLRKEVNRLLDAR